MSDEDEIERWVVPYSTEPKPSLADQLTTAGAIKGVLKWGDTEVRGTLFVDGEGTAFFESDEPR